MVELSAMISLIDVITSDQRFTTVLVTHDNNGEDVAFKEALCGS